MSRSYKNTTIAILLACILTMAIGYAVLNTRLNISGTSKITTDFNIEVVGINEKLLLGLAETSSKSISADSATYNVNIQAPGDSAMYEIVVENKGTVTGTSKIADNLTTMITSSNGIAIGVFGVSKEEKKFTTYSEFGAVVESLYLENPNGEVTLAPGEKAYYYAAVIFDEDATSIPSQKNYSNELKFTFTSVDNSGTVTGTTYNLSDVLLEDTAVVTSGAGLYLTDNSSIVEYIYKSNTGEDFNNYVEIDGKLWRVGTIRLNESSTYYSYELIEVGDNYQIFSTTAGSDGYYNDIYNSTLWDDLYANWAYEYLYFTFEGDIYDCYYKYIIDNGFYIHSGVQTMGIYDRALMDIRQVMKYSSSSSCSYSNLSTGGCQSWLTDNGDTYLMNPIYTSSGTNTGNIAYLHQGKVIGVDPQDTNYGMYKMVINLINPCNKDHKITNYGIGDGSKDNPYIIDVGEEVLAEIDACW